MALTLHRHGPDDPDLPAILTLIQTEFAFMDGVIDPPSSMHRLTLDTLRTQATTGEIWSLGPPLAACVIFQTQEDALYIGKLSVDAKHRGRGLARQLVEHAATRANTRGLKALELEVRVELTANHAAFGKMGFHETGRTAHDGYTRPTSIAFRRTLA